MRVYPAGKSCCWHWFLALQSAGAPLQASWLTWAFNRDPNAEPTDDDYREHSEVCLREAGESDIVLLYVPPDCERNQFGGLLEAGACLGRGGWCYLVSRHRWPFLRCHPRCRSFDTLAEAVTALMAQESGERLRVEAQDKKRAIRAV
jgi:hypothetical protein